MRHYSHLDEHPQAHEEWWGGAVGLDHFLHSALSDFLESMAEGQGRHEHQWRAWVVNTKFSWQQGSHWFTVVVGARSQLHSDLSAGSVISMLATSTRPSAPRPGTEQSRQESPSAGGCTDAFHFPALFPAPSLALQNALSAANKSSTTVAAVSVTRACQAWNAALADGTYTQPSKRRKLRKDHGLLFTRDMLSDPEAAARSVRSQLRARLLQQDSSLSQYFTRIVFVLCTSHDSPCIK